MRAGPRPLRLRELARLRRATYRLLGATLLHPGPELIATLARVAGDLIGKGSSLRALAFWAEWDRCLHLLRALGRSDVATLQAAYARCFLPASGMIACPPSESAYGSRVEIGELVGDLEGCYAASGVAVAGAAPDHGAVELEFMGALCGVEERAWQSRAIPEAAGALQRELRFLDHHLVRWFPEFADRVERHDPGGVYARVTSAARAFLRHDWALVAALHARMARAAVG
jgi:TorA maturation chaperone TorD